MRGLIADACQLGNLAVVGLATYLRPMTEITARLSTALANRYKIPMTPAG